MNAMCRYMPETVHPSSIGDAIGAKPSSSQRPSVSATCRTWREPYRRPARAAHLDVQRHALCCRVGSSLAGARLTKH